MGSPDRVVKGSASRNGTQSVRYYKNLENGYIVVVERELSTNSGNMENITMWAEKSRSTNSTSASLKGTSVITSERELAKATVQRY